MKICTDIEQSSKLLEIGISIETADMCYEIDKNLINLKAYNLVPLNRLSKKEKTEYFINKDYIPAWSLAALFEAMPSEIDDNHFLTLEKEGKEYCCCYEDINGNSFKHEFGDNSIDACYEMIVKLHEKGLL